MNVSMLGLKITYGFIVCFFSTALQSSELQKDQNIPSIMYTSFSYDKEKDASFAIRYSFTDCKNPFEMPGSKTTTYTCKASINYVGKAGEVKIDQPMLSALKVSPDAFTVDELKLQFDIYFPEELFTTVMPKKYSTMQVDEFKARVLKFSGPPKVRNPMPANPMFPAGIPYRHYSVLTGLYDSYGIREENEKIELFSPGGKAYKFTIASIATVPDELKKLFDKYQNLDVLWNEYAPAFSQYMVSVNNTSLLADYANLSIHELANAQAALFNLYFSAGNRSLKTHAQRELNYCIALLQLPSGLVAASPKTREGKKACEDNEARAKSQLADIAEKQVYPALIKIVNEINTRIQAAEEKLEWGGYTEDDLHEYDFIVKHIFKSKLVGASFSERLLGVPPNGNLVSLANELASIKVQRWKAETYKKLQEEQEKINREASNEHY